MQADPFVDGVTDTQGYNRYAYVRNNPLNATDPSGYSRWKEYGGLVVGVVVGWWTGGLASGWVGTWGSAWASTSTGALTMAGGAAVGAISGAAAGFSMGLVSSGGDFGAALTSAAWGAVSGAAFGGIGASKLKGLVRVGAHAVTGGITSVLQGGKFGHGFVSAGLTKYLGINDILGTAPELGLVRVIAAAVLGGTISDATGGKFANGAITAAFGQALNGESDARAAQKGDTTNDSGVEQHLPDPKPSWITRVKTFFGLPGGKPGNVAAGVGGTLVTTGIKALDTDVAAGVASISIRKNLNLCEGAGNCWVPDDDISIRGYLGEDPPNYKGVGDLFIRREWDFVPLTEQVKNL